MVEADKERTAKIAAMQIKIDQAMASGVSSLTMDDILRKARAEVAAYKVRQPRV